MILVIDNYDSFVFNLVQYVGVHDTVLVRRNDTITVSEIDALGPDGIVVSPGPGTPAKAGVSIPIFANFDYPILGVCLGHQALCAAAGAPVGPAESVIHGKYSKIYHDGRGLFAGVSNPLEVGRYHSLAVERGDLPEELIETAWTDASPTAEASVSASKAPAEGRTDDERGVVMAVRHREKPHVGVQFHPESILTESGEAMIASFCEWCHDGDDNDGDDNDGDDNDGDDHDSYRGRTRPNDWEESVSSTT